MERILEPRPLRGTLRAVASKSMAHRLLICAALSDQETQIICPDVSGDIDATVRCLSALGAEIRYENGVFSVWPIGENLRNAPLLDCGESGSTLRFLLPVAAALGADARFVMSARLAQRPLLPLLEAMQTHGCRFSRPAPNILVCKGRLQSGRYCIDGDVSSQFISGLLLALPLLDGQSDIMLTSLLESAPYAAMTRQVLSAFGVHWKGWHIQPQRFCSAGSYIVEGDWSNAAFWLCAGAVRGEISLHGLNLDSCQGDAQIVSILKNFGADLNWHEDILTVRAANLNAQTLDVRDIPDLVPPLALLAGCAHGQTRFLGAGRLRGKESDRLDSIAKTLNALGGHAQQTHDSLLITGGNLTGGRVDSCGDHRIAMLAAIASTVCRKPVVLSGAEAVCKSYPTFWQHFDFLRKEETP